MTVRPPVEPRVDLLPLDDEQWEWKRFERFCVGLAKALPDVAHASLNGEPGEYQAGFDVLAELVDGRTRVYQCRKRKAFGPKAVAKTIAEAELDADEYVVLVTRSVSRAVRKVVGSRPGWRLLDKEDICQTVRGEIDRERARNLVEDAFGADWRRAFLGPAGALAFVEPERHFAPFLNENSLLRHTWNLVGRTDVLEELADAALSPNVLAIVLPGRGGIGKTRLLRALTQRLANHRLLFLRETASLTPIDVEALPFTEAILFVDNADGREDLPTLFAETVRRAEPVKLVLASRPPAIDQIVGDLVRSGFPIEQIRVFDALGDLGAEDAQSLAREALGAEHATHAYSLAEATADCPLVTVVGGQLLAKRALSPELLERQDDFRAVVLDRWRDEMLGRVSDRVDTRIAALVLRQLAALAPLSIEDDSTLRAMALEAQQSVPELRTVLGELEAAGVLLARGRLRRITPGVLADHVLYRACLDARGRPTGYAEELVHRYAATSLPSLLRNVGALDWRVGQTTGATTLLVQVWHDLKEALIDAAAPGRAGLLEALRQTAIFQPGPVLDLVHLALAQPAASASTPGPFGVGITDEDVRRRLPDLLQAVGLHPDYTARVLRLLWQMGRDQSGELHSQPSHPVRVLRELGGYGQTPSRSEALANLVEELVTSTDELDGRHWSPLVLLTPLLEREGRRLRSVGFGFQIGSYQVLAEPTAGVRHRALGLLERQARDGTPRNRLLAAELLGGALRQPRGIAGQRVEAEHFDQWLPDQVALLARLEKLYREADHLVRMQLRLEIEWHARHSAWPEVRARAEAILALPAELDERLLRAIAHPWNRTGDVQDWNAHVRDATEELVGLPGDVDLLAERIDALAALMVKARGSTVELGPLLACLAKASSTGAAGLVRWMLVHPGRLLAANLHTLLTGLRGSSAENLADALRVLRQGDRDERRQLAAFLAGGSWFEDAQPEELDLLRGLLRDDDEAVRANALLAVLRYGQVERGRSVELALSAELGDSADLADLFSQTLCEGHSPLTEEQISVTLNKLSRVRALDWSAGQLLVRLGEDVPARVVEFLVHRARTDDGSEFEPLPFDRIEGDLLSGAPDDEYLRLLRSVRQAAYDTEDGLVRHHLGNVFWQLDRDLDLCLLVLHEWLATDEDEHVSAAASLLWGMSFGRTHPRNEIEDAWLALLHRRWFIVDLIQRAAQVGGRVQERVEEVLRAVLTGGTFGRSLGGIDPRWQQTQRDANAMTAVLPQGTAPQRFYAWLAAYAERRLEADRLEDEEYGEELR